MRPISAHNDELLLVSLSVLVTAQGPNLVYRSGEQTLSRSSSEDHRSISILRGRYLVPAILQSGLRCNRKAMNPSYPRTRTRFRPLGLRRCR
ncbi:hypothetical protein EV421DRAFT_767625 [Armillaria borealis]|uniref:Secreted protein n=1 Tax=Armillaria borealis TaxID=47425 RepID=A0AA39JDL7_9AGAR|nr:hypothetical protein EV421DRAFT_767625 [Armillaria borealis]